MSMHLVKILRYLFTGAYNIIDITSKSQKMRDMKILLRTIGFLGLIFNSALLGLTFGVPDAFEESAIGFVKAQIEIELKEKYNERKASAFSEKAIVIAENMGIEEQVLSESIENKLPEKIAETIAFMCGYDCERKKALTQSIAAGFKERIANLQVAQFKLSDIIKGKYLEIVSELKFDLRIFLGSNSVIFLILIVVSIIKPQATTHLYLPSLLLCTSAVIASAIYLFGQDWFYTILYNDYMGFGYLIYISVIFAFLMDISFNKARVTTEIINGILSSISSTFSVASC